MDETGAAGVAGPRAGWSLDAWRTGKLYFMADPHFGHERIIELSQRPFGSVGEMNKGILDGINSTVGRRDTLVIVGDTALGKLNETLKLLTRVRAARIWLLPGNHDRFSLAYRHSGAAETQRMKRGLWRTQYESARDGIRAEPDLVPSVWGMRVGGRRVMLSHYPYRGAEGDAREAEARRADRLAMLKPQDTGYPLIHGHVHHAWQRNGRMLNVGVDVWDFKPVAESVVADWVSGLDRVTVGEAGG